MNKTLFENLQLLENDKIEYFYKIIGEKNYTVVKSNIDVLGLYGDKSLNVLGDLLIKCSTLNNYDLLYIGKIVGIDEVNKDEYDVFVNNVLLSGYEDEDDAKIYVIYFLSQNNSMCYLAKSGVTFNINNAKYVNKEDAIKIYKNRINSKSNKEYEIYDTKNFKDVTNELIK